MQKKPAVEYSEVDGEIIVLWFSLTGDFIPGGSSGNLFNIDFEVNADAPDGTTSIDLTDETTFANSDGESMYWGYNGTDLEIGLPDVYLSLVQIADEIFEVHMTNNDVVSGYQFTIDDNPDNYTFDSIESTSRVPADWMLSGAEAGGNAILLGFSIKKL